MVLHDLAQIVPKVTQLDDGLRLPSISWCFRWEKAKGWSLRLRLSDYQKGKYWETVICK